MPSPYNPSARCVIEQAADILSTCLALQTKWEQEITDGLWSDAFGSAHLAFFQRQIETASQIISSWSKDGVIEPRRAMVLLEKFEPNWELQQ